jgi:hypothetical protein
LLVVTTDVQLMMCHFADAMRQIGRLKMIMKSTGKMTKRCDGRLRREKNPLLAAGAKNLAIGEFFLTTRLRVSIPRLSPRLCILEFRVHTSTMTCQRPTPTDSLLFHLESSVPSPDGPQACPSTHHYFSDAHKTTTKQGQFRCAVKHFFLNERRTEWNTHTQAHSSCHRHSKFLMIATWY